jgi:hypothetical protein
MLFVCPLFNYTVSSSEQLCNIVLLVRTISGKNLEGMWKEAVMVQFVVLSSIYLEGLNGIAKICQGMQSLVPNLKSIPLQRDADMLLTGRRSSFMSSNAHESKRV